MLHEEIPYPVKNVITAGKTVLYRVRNILQLKGLNSSKRAFVLLSCSTTGLDIKPVPSDVVLLGKTDTYKENGQMGVFVVLNEPDDSNR